MMSESVTVTVNEGGAPGRPAYGLGKPIDPNQPVVGGIRVTGEHFRTLPGLIKIVQLVIGFICILTGAGGFGSGNWFCFVVIVAFIMTALWIAVYGLSLREAVRFPINWNLTELFNTGIHTILYFTAFITELAWAPSARYYVAGIFGLFNTLAYAAGTYFLYLEYQSNLQ